MVRISKHGLLTLAWLYVPFLARAEALPAQKDLICSNTDPKDCYPRIFVPTENFQNIREGQDIPPGLHVRLNIFSGQKEARLNIPMAEDESSHLEGLPTEQAVVVVDPPANVEEELEAEQPVIPPNAPAFESAGKIVPPPPGGDDMSSFSKAMVMIQMEGRFFDNGLDDLIELSHDIYYGVEIVKDGPVLEKLICFLLGSGSEHLKAKDKERDHKAAMIISSALQNNPTALKEAENFSNSLIKPICRVDGSEKLKAGQSEFVARLRSKLGSEKDPATLKAKISAISNLLKIPKFQAYFLQKQGMELLLAMFLKKGEKWDVVKKKVSQLVTDNFLDESLGAEVGVWPEGARSETKTCQTRGKMLGDGCWEHHVQSYAKESGSSWADEFYVALKQARNGSSDQAPEKEL